MFGILRPTPHVRWTPECGRTFNAPTMKSCVGAHLRVRPIVAVLFRCRGTPACGAKTGVIYEWGGGHRIMGGHTRPPPRVFFSVGLGVRTEERRVGEEGRARWSAAR